MAIPIILFIIGLILLIKGGDWFVDGASGIAHHFHIPEFLIGATIVSIGTTLPEVMVSATSALSGHGEIAYGNAIGSIICNTALIAAVSITIHPSKIDRKPILIAAIFFFVSAALYVSVAYSVGSFSRIIGFLMLLIFVAYISLSIHQATKNISLSDDTSSPDTDKTDNDPIWKNILLLIVGAAFIAFGADLLVDNGTLIAEAIGVPEAVIGLTFVALGTSLPELVTAITSLVKGHGAMSLGNIVGANLFNIVLVSGVATTLSPFSIPQNTTIAGINSSLIIDIPVMLSVMLILTVPALIRQKLSRVQGIVLLVIYAAFCALQFII